MADEKQLTVAELLARSGEKSSSGDQSRPRRRRRSLEDGGVSVAELTGSIPKVKSKPVESRHSSVPLDEQAAAEDTTAETTRDSGESEPAGRAAETSAEPATAPKEAEAEPESAALSAPDAAPRAGEETEPATPPPSREDTQVIGAVEGGEPVRREGPVFTGATDTARDAAAAVPSGLATGAAATAVDSTGEIPAVVGPDGGAVEPGVDKYAEQEHEEAEYAEEGPGEGVSVPAVIGLAVAGVIVGVLIFLGFDYLWGNVNRIAVGISALVVTAVMVAGTRALRTTNDALSMTMAGAVGLLMTFGPALIMFLT